MGPAPRPSSHALRARSAAPVDPDGGDAVMPRAHRARTSRSTGRIVRSALPGAGAVRPRRATCHTRDEGQLVPVGARERRRSTTRVAVGASTVPSSRPLKWDPMRRAPLSAPEKRARYVPADAVARSPTRSGGEPRPGVGSAPPDTPHPARTPGRTPALRPSCRSSGGLPDAAETEVTMDDHVPHRVDRRMADASRSGS